MLEMLRMGGPGSKEQDVYLEWRGILLSAARRDGSQPRHYPVILLRQ